MCHYLLRAYVSSHTKAYGCSHTAAAVVCSQRVRCAPSGTQWCTGEYPCGLVLERSSRSEVSILLNEIVIAPAMFTSHLPNKYHQSLKLLAEMPAAPALRV